MSSIIIIRILKLGEIEAYWNAVQKELGNSQAMPIQGLIVPVWHTDSFCR